MGKTSDISPPQNTPKAAAEPAIEIQNELDLQKEDDTDVPSPDADTDIPTNTNIDLFPPNVFFSPPGQPSFFGDDFNFGNPLGDMDWFAMTQPYYNRAVPYRLDGDYDAIRLRWIDTFDMALSLGFNAGDAAWISNTLTPMAIDSALQGDFPTAFELSNQELGLSPTMVNAPAIHFKKLEVGQPNDQYEQEAEAVADRVMRQTETFVQRQCAECEEEEKIQQKRTFSTLFRSSGNSDTRVKPWVQSQIEASRGAGQKLSENIRGEMESGIGASFQDVKVHTDNNSVQMNRELGARAFAVGNDVYFNAGQYQPESSEGKRLLAHELTHTVQQGASPQMIQKDGDGTTPTPAPSPQPEESSSSSGSSDPLARLVGGLVRDQLSDSGMKTHIRNLGNALQSLAVGATTEPTDQPQDAAERLSALAVAQAFEASSARILADEDFQALRQNLIRILSSSDEAVLLAALAAGLVAFLADVNVAASPEGEIADSGVSLGASFDLGSMQDINFNELRGIAQYANDYFLIRAEGGATRDETPEGSEEPGPIIGVGTGRFRLGNELGNLTATVSFDSTGRLTLGGSWTAGHEFSGGNRLVFTTEVEHSFDEGTTTVSPELSGRFRFGRGGSLRLGSSLDINLQEGLSGATGFMEYERNRIHLRIEGRMGGIRESSGIVPGGNMLVQGMLTVEF